MLGSIIGDYIGSVYEFDNFREVNFPLFARNNCFTDDTVMTIAIADAIMSGKSYEEKLKEWYLKYPDCSYGNRFRKWASLSVSLPAYSYGNGAAMRVSPIGFAFDSVQKVLDEAKLTAIPSHNHSESIVGAQSVALAIWLAKKGFDKKDIKSMIEFHSGYNLNFKIDDIRKTYSFDVTCKGTVPVALIAFLESTDFENAIRLAISVGGDSDTIACITGGVAEAFYKDIPDRVAKHVLDKMPKDIRIVYDNFRGVV